MLRCMNLILPHFLSDHMVVQQKQPVALWGRATPGATVEASCAGAAVAVVVDPDGRWSLKLPPVPAGGPYTIHIQSGTEAVTLQDVLCGEVWLCSGQSNMEWTVASANFADQEISSAHFPHLRLLNVVPKRQPRDEPQEDLEASWSVCTPQSVASFSAVGYFFGRELHRHREVPIGLINSSWGGTKAEAWTERSYLQKDGDFQEIIQAYEQIRSGLGEEAASTRAKLEHWNKVMYWQDPGNRGFLYGWGDRNYDDAEWMDFTAPGLWQSRGHDFNGAVWFRKKVFIPTAWADQEIELRLGAIDDFDVTYVNGLPVGQTGQETPAWWQHPRRYQTPANNWKPGTDNVIAIRVFDWFGNGGLAGGEKMELVCGGQRMPIDGGWKMKVEYAFPATAPQGIQKLMAIGSPNTQSAPSNLYNGMIAPLTPFPLAGVIWYQGESNADRHQQYRKLFPLLIESWRAAWKQPAMPFLFVQLANYLPVQTDPGESGWANIRAAQAEALNLPHTGMAVAIDIGDADDIHPRDKQTVGRRLALTARAMVYGEPIEDRGPVFAGMTVQGSIIRISYTHASGLRTSDGGAPQGFVIRGGETGWRFAEARIEGDGVVMWHPEITDPVAVRYAWANHPKVNLYNQAGLPAVPFATE